MGEVWPLSLLKGAVYNRDENCNSGHNDDVDGDVRVMMRVMMKVMINISERD